MDKFWHKRNTVNCKRDKDNSIYSSSYLLFLCVIHNYYHIYLSVSILCVLRTFWCNPYLFVPTYPLKAVSAHQPCQLANRVSPPTVSAQQPCQHTNVSGPPTLLAQQTQRRIIKLNVKEAEQHI